MQKDINNINQVLVNQDSIIRELLIRVQLHISQQVVHQVLIELEVVLRKFEDESSPSDLARPQLVAFEKCLLELLQGAQLKVLGFAQVSAYALLVLDKVARILVRLQVELIVVVLL